MTLWLSVPGAMWKSIMALRLRSLQSDSSLASDVDAEVRRLIEQNRQVRVPSNCAITAVGWIFFGLFYVVRNVPYSALLCLFFGILTVGVYCLIIRYPARRRRYANLFLATTFIGLGLESATSGMSLSNTLPFFCCIGVMAAHQAGIRTAFVWTALSAALVAAFHFILDASLLPQFRSYNLFNSAIAFAGLYMLVTSMAAQAEWFATKYLTMLVNTANEMTHIAQHDQLTQLANRYCFRSELREAIERHQVTGECVGLMLLDLDSFKDVNDTLGHVAGDTVLQEVASRLLTQIDEQHTVARIGGDEFTVIVRSATREKMKRIALDVAEAFTRPIRVAEKKVPMSTSIGAALFPDDTNSIDELQAFADLAVYASKRSDRPLAFYTPAMSETAIRKRTLADKLSNAIERNEFSLVYQPQVCTSTGKIFGVEALLRWTPMLTNASDRAHSRVVSPAEFVPILESTGQIIEVGRWVLEQACLQSNRWSEMGIDCCVSVNVSPIQFQSAKFVENVLEVLRISKLEPGRLDLEITEGILVDRFEETRDKLQRLKDIGVKISVDDFGTGYSSLAYLKYLSLDRLKIDRAFIKDIPCFDDGSIAAAIVGMAKSLNLSVLAEGVETDEQLSFLSQLDCEEYQGFLFSKPLATSECTEMLLADLLSQTCKQEATFVGSE